MVSRNTGPVVFSRRTALKLIASLSASVAPMTLYAQDWLVLTVLVTEPAYRSLVNGGLSAETSR